MDRLVNSETRFELRVSRIWQIVNIGNRSGRVTTRLNCEARIGNRSVVDLISPQVCTLIEWRCQRCIDACWQDLLWKLLHTHGEGGSRDSFPNKRWQRFHELRDARARKRCLSNLD